MGKPGDNQPEPDPSPLGESSSSINLHSTNLPVQRYFDDDPAELNPDDLPPLYSDHDLDAAPDGPLNPLLPPGARDIQIKPFRNKPNDTTYYLDQQLASDPKALEDHIQSLTQWPPRPTVSIRGTHHETTKTGDKSERREVVDFDITLDLTHLLYETGSLGGANARPWRDLRTTGNFEKVRRGTIFTTRAPGFGGSGTPEVGQPDLSEWCHRFCASHAGLKSFAFERRVTGWDFDHIREKIESLIRSTNYRGHAKVTFPMNNARVEIYNDCRTNRWRLTKWIEVLFIFTLMFVFAWPWLFFRTKRWETVYAEWKLGAVDDQGRKRYPAMSEDRWYNLWARPIQKAILERRQCTLDQGDLDRMDPSLGPQAPQEGFAGWVQAGVDAMGVVNRQFGWGADS